MATAVRSPHSQFRAKLRARCREVGITSQKMLAERLGTVSRATISRWFSGKAVPSLPEAARLAKALNASLDWLAGNSNAALHRPDGDLESDVRWLCNQISYERAFIVLANAEAADRAARMPSVDLDPVPEAGTTYAEGDRPAHNRPAKSG